MKKLEKSNSHKRDSRINFNEKEHSYTIDNQEKAISVTQLIHKFFPKFDKNYVYYCFETPKEEACDE